MARVLGIGGVFFKSPEPARLRAWYAQWLGIPESEFGAVFPPADMPPRGYQVWSPFDVATRYFSPGTRDFMFNLIVDDLDGALAQVRASGVAVMDAIEESEFGRFGWFVDPDGNKVELWQPPNPTEASAAAANAA